MMNRPIALFVLASAAFAQTNWDKAPKDLTVGFPDGSGLAIHSESTGASSPTSTTGWVSVGKGDHSQRRVLDKSGHAIFGYNIEMRKAGPDTFTVQIKPAREALSLRTEADGKKVVTYMQTLADAREFPPLRVGDAVQVDILYNPATGEKIYDVLKVLPPRAATPRAPAGTEISLEDVRVLVNGKATLAQDGVWMRGAGYKIHLPGRDGEYFLTLSPPAEFPFQPSGWVDHNVLRFHDGSDLLEFVGKSNILGKTEFGTVWVYHDLAPVPANTGTVFSCADDVLWLMRDKKAKQE